MNTPTNASSEAGALDDLMDPEHDIDDGPTRAAAAAAAIERAHLDPAFGTSHSGRFDLPIEADSDARIALRIGRGPTLILPRESAMHILRLLDDAVVLEHSEYASLDTGFAATRTPVGIQNVEIRVHLVPEKLFAMMSAEF